MWDFRKPGWGWSIELIKTTDQGKTWEAVGWGAGLKEGDLVVLAGPSFHEGNDTSGAAYVLSAFAYFSDPKDMWRATLVHTYNTLPAFAPRSLSQVFNLGAPPS
jgi:hypothetical protein